MMEAPCFYKWGRMSQNGSVYIQGDKLMVYIESKRGTCYLMPVSMTDAYGAEYSQNSISMVYTCEEIPSTYTVDYLHI